MTGKFKNYAALERIISMTETIDPLKKIFDPSGTFKLRFAQGDEKGIKDWTADQGISYRVVMAFAEPVDDEIFGLAFEFPCRLV